MRHLPYVCLILLTCVFAWAENDTAYAAPQTFYEFTISEGEEFSIKLDVDDPDGDELKFRFDVPLDTKGKWKTTFADAGNYESFAHIDDGETVVDVRLVLHVLDVNRPVEKLTIKGIETYQETETVRFAATFEDKDAESISVQWFWDEKLTLQENVTTYESIFSLSTNYGDKGPHTLFVQVSDGKSQINETKNVTLTKRNRAPIVELPSQMVFYEGDLVEFPITASDPDNDTLSINVSESWQTGYKDAGDYSFPISVSDGEIIVVLTYNITVMDVNRLPQILSPETSEISENTPLEIFIEAKDEDGDTVELSVTNLPEGATFTDGLLRYTPPFWTTHKQSKRFDVLITASDGKNMTTSTLPLSVLDVNRPPAFDPYNVWGNEVTVNEGEELILAPKYADPDDDLITISYAGWMDSRSKKVGYLEQGKHSVLITATDGEYAVTQKVIVKIINTNDPPVLKSIPTLHVYEGETLAHTFVYSDQDVVAVQVDGIPAILDGSSMHWTPSAQTVFNSSQSFVSKVWDTVVFWRPTGAYKEFEGKVIATDTLGLSSEEPFFVRVYDRNLAPLVIGVTPASQIIIFQNDVLTLSAQVEDESNLSYHWDFGLFDTHDGGNTHTRKFTQLGVHQVELTISDGDLETVVQWNIEVVPFLPPKKEEPKVEPVVEKKEVKAPEPPKPTGPKVITLT